MSDFPTADSRLVREFAAEVAADLELPWHLLGVGRDLTEFHEILSRAEESPSADIPDKSRIGVVIMLAAIIQSQIRRSSFWNDVRVDSCATLSGHLLSVLQDDDDADVLRFISRTVFATVARRSRHRTLTSVLTFLPNLYIRSKVPDLNLFRMIAYQEITSLGNMVAMHPSDKLRDQFCELIVAAVEKGQGTDTTLHEVIELLSRSMKSGT
jgi:hypothetical protein